MFQRSTAVLGLLSLNTLLTACGQTKSVAPPPTEVAVSAVTERTLRSWDDFAARLQAIQSVDVHPRVDGVIDRATFVEGSHVRKGDLLFQIDPRPYQAQVDRMAAQL